MEKIYKDCSEATDFNYELCTTIAMEECAELIQAISKVKRGKLDRENLAEEIADVMICVDWIQDVFKISDSEVSSWYEKKQNRVVERLNKGEFK